MSPILTVTHLSKVFEGARTVRAVDDLSFSVGPGELVGILGPNGAGKTTTIRMLISVLRPSAGTISYFGKELFSHRSEVLQHVAFASTYTNLPLFLSVGENLDIHGRLYGMTRTDRQRRADELLSYFGVRDLTRQRVSQLSAGQKTRVMLAKAFLSRPKIALLDEPTASLDPDIALDVRRFVREEQRKNGTAILFSSHNMNEVADLCDRVLFLKQGRLLTSGTPQQLAAEAKLATLVLDGVEQWERGAACIAPLGDAVQRLGSTVRIRISEEGGARLVVALVQHGVSFSGLHLEKPTLEDFFLKHSATSTGEPSLRSV